MITISNVSVGGMDIAIRAMRNPLNSWDKSDSHYENGDYVIGHNDLTLAKNLVKAGTDHSKFMRMITVWTDINAPLYWWKEFDTYKVGTVRNSCSTMHKIHAKEFVLDDFSHEHLINEYQKTDNEYLVYPPTILTLKGIIEQLNFCRDKFIATKEKRWWWQMIQLLPSSYNQRATVQMNYQVLRGLYKARKDHKLDEWHTFCDWVKTLPYSELITTDFSKE